MTDLFHFEEMKESFKLLVKQGIKIVAIVSIPAIISVLIFTFAGRINIQNGSTAVSVAFTTAFIAFGLNAYLFTRPGYQRKLKRKR